MDQMLGWNFISLIVFSHHDKLAYLYVFSATYDDLMATLPKESVLLLLQRMLRCGPSHWFSTLPRAHLSINSSNGLMVRLPSNGCRFNYQTYWITQ
jgi:hypothetical protein